MKQTSREMILNIFYMILKKTIIFCLFYLVVCCTEDLPLANSMKS